MTLRGIGDITTQDIGAALSQAGTILNPGTYTTTYGGGVLYTPAPGANIPGGVNAPSAPVVIGGTAMSPGMLLLLAGGAFMLMKGGGK